MSFFLVAFVIKDVERDRAIRSYGVTSIQPDGSRPSLVHLSPGEKSDAPPLLLLLPPPRGQPRENEKSLVRNRSLARFLQSIVGGADPT